MALLFLAVFGIFACESNNSSSSNKCHAKGYANSPSAGVYKEDVCALILKSLDSGVY